MSRSIWTSAAEVKIFADDAELLPGLTPDGQADRSVTVEQILGQVSGPRETVDAATPTALGVGDGALLEAARLVVGAGNEREPGERWSYYNGNYFLAGSALADLSGRPGERPL
ncbi:hypothetical protein [Streptomyces sp. S.PB5]|uniref:hypothetical protein n=1 Tax=Streptomyces sp. S.PB5 TaxID=3020844 RepID=UPI0025AFDD5E|nr:hypothetical protein [Streptomyces sp. S.PB5]MDN3027182.1 hypothetical protein [Streptomyces sp. S.PB5]